MTIDDFFNNSDFSVNDYINQKFPNEQSLASIDEHIASIREKIDQHDEEISLAVRGQTIFEKDAKIELDKATTIINELIHRIQDMKSQANRSGQTVNEITFDIKQLDNAKRNLTTAVTMLNNLNILVESVEKLKEIYNKNEYRQVASILAGIQDVLKQFNDYKQIPQISELSSEIDRLCDIISDSINFDFKRLFQVPNANSSMSKEDIKLIAEACLVVSLLGEEVRENLIIWFLELQLTKYTALFKDTQIQLSSLNKVDKRYAWFKKNLLEFEEKYGFLFPPNWQMSQKMAIEFCKLTRSSIIKVMENYPNDANLDSILFATTKTKAFEDLLAKRFENSENAFDSIISSSFEPHYKVFVEAQETSLKKLIDQFVDEHQKIAKSKSQQCLVFPSSNKLFQQFKNSLVQCVQLTNKSALLDLHFVFKRCLTDYSSKVLQIHLKNSAGFLQRRDDASRSNQICCVTLTADYCLETIGELEKKLKERIDPSLASEIYLKPEMDIFSELISVCQRLLSGKFEFRKVQNGESSKLQFRPIG